uniref:Uncharacterized protein n=1 Tax=Phasianus colchicus TaxID=9054 RepID=A0A669QZM9_PHACC
TPSALHDAMMWNDFFILLSQEKISCELTDLKKNLSVYCCKAYGDEEVEKIHEFASRGDVLQVLLVQISEPWLGKQRWIELS